MKIIARNKRASYDYDISDKLVAGIVLSGAEVKSIKAGHISLKGSFVQLTNGELYIKNAHINPYKFAIQSDYDPTQPRKLLIHKKQLKQLASSLESTGMSAVPLAIGLERGLVKVEVGIGQGKSRFDKRETIKKRIMNREASIEAKDRKAT